MPCRRRIVPFLAVLVFSCVAGGGAVEAAAPAKAGAGAGAGAAGARVLVQFERPPGAAEEALVRGLGGRVDRKFSIVPALAVTVPEAALEGLRRAPGVVVVEPDLEVTANEINNTWGVKRIGCGAVHSGAFAEGASGVRGAGVKVAVFDSGIDYTHPELALVYAGGYDYVNNDPDPMDDHGHGTHVSGTVAAARDGFGVVGAAPEVALYALKVLSKDGSGSYSMIISGLDWCVANGVKVANFSLGSAGHPGSTVETAFRNAEKAGILLIASAGNAGEGADTVGYPAKFDTVVAVASTTSQDARSNFSSTGPAVELAAPGSSIYSTRMGGGYATMSGTSMAAPHVAGVAALVYSAGVTDGNGDGKLNDDVRLVLQATAEDLGVAGRDPYFGYGLVDAGLAVLMVYDSGDDTGGGDPEPEPEPEPEPVFDAPANLSGSSSSSTVSLQWLDRSTGEDGFQIQYGVKARGRVTWSDWATVGQDVTSHSGNLSDGTYLFRVRAFRGSPVDVTAWSNEIELSVKASGGGGSKGGGPKTKKSSKK